MLRFRKPAGTSRGVLREKPSYFLLLRDEETAFTAIGECGLLPGLSADDRPGYEATLQNLTDALNAGAEGPDLTTWPSIALGLDMARRNLEAGAVGQVFPSDFTHSSAAMRINGLVWMGTREEMRAQIDQKLAEGFDCIKLKIGAIDFEAELDLLAYIRSRYPADVIEIRVDANGAFAPDEALTKLEALAQYGLHSIEQPIPQGQWKAMAQLCAATPLPIMLDEELIGVHDPQAREALMDTIRPQGIILKPSFLGTFAESDHWISLADRHGAMWWITSALESNVGLNAIAQYTFTKQPTMHQGLGTGSLYTNNFDSPLRVSGGAIRYRAEAPWNLKPLL